MPNQPIDHLQPVLLILAAILLLNIVYLLFLKKKISIGAFIMMNTGLVVLAGVNLLFSIGTLADEFNRTGDFISTLLLIIIFILGVISALICIRHLNKLKQ
ncbi:hypothetical protein [Halobacillus sp. H74]|uniref:hypothetical protein n=1 Tax=Halobacillus sp. H74 TaxID=3457436 RepID=UPI003FCED61B